MFIWQLYLVRIIWSEVYSDIPINVFRIHCELILLGLILLLLAWRDTFRVCRKTFTDDVWRHRRKIIIVLLLCSSSIRVQVSLYDYTTVILEDDLSIHGEYLYLPETLHRHRFSYCTTQCRWQLNYLRCFREVVIRTLCDISCKRSLSSESQSNDKMIITKWQFTCK